MTRIRECDHLILMKLPGVTEQVNNVPFRKTFFFYMTLSPPIFPEKLLLCCFSVKLIPSRIFIQCIYVTEVSELVKVSEFFFSPLIQRLVILFLLEFQSLNQSDKVLTIFKPQFFHEQDNN